MVHHRWTDRYPVDWTGYRRRSSIFKPNFPERSFSAQPSDNQPKEEASIITIHTPEQIIAGNDFTLVMQIHNQNAVPIHVREVILPSLIVNNMEVVGTEPAVDHINKYDAGKGFPFNLVIPAGKGINYYLLS